MSSCSPPSGPTVDGTGARCRVASQRCKQRCCQATPKPACAFQHAGQEHPLEPPRLPRARERPMEPGPFRTRLLSRFGYSALLKICPRGQDRWASGSLACQSARLVGQKIPLLCIRRAAPQRPDLLVGAGRTTVSPGGCEGKHAPAPTSALRVRPQFAQPRPSSRFVHDQNAGVFS